MKLRIPLILFTFGLLSGAVQLITSMFETTFFSSSIITIVYFLIIAIALITFERTRLSEKNVNVIIAFIIILAGLLADLIPI